jgi:hypothetical protein
MPASLPRKAQRVSAWLCRIYLHFCIDPIRCPLLETQVIQRTWIGPLSRTRARIDQGREGCVDLISDGYRLVGCGTTPRTIALGYAMHFSRSHNAVIRAYDDF